MSFKAYHLSEEGSLRLEVGEEGVREAFESKRGLIWVDVQESSG